MKRSACAVVATLVAGAVAGLELGGCHDTFHAGRVSALLEGRVTDASGRPTPGATLEVDFAPAPMCAAIDTLWPAGYDGGCRVDTDSTGHYALRLVSEMDAPGGFCVRVRLAGTPSVTRTVWASFDAPPPASDAEDTLRVDFVLPPPGPAPPANGAAAQEPAAGAGRARDGRPRPTPPSRGRWCEHVD